MPEEEKEAEKSADSNTVDLLRVRYERLFQEKLALDTKKRETVNKRHDLEQRLRLVKRSLDRTLRDIDGVSMDLLRIEAEELSLRQAEQAPEPANQNQTPLFLQLQEELRRLKESLPNFRQDILSTELLLAQVVSDEEILDKERTRQLRELQDIIAKLQAADEKRVTDGGKDGA